MGKLLSPALVALMPLPAFASEPAGTLPGSAIEIGGPVLMVTELDRSLNFYIDGLGLQASTRLPGNPGPGVILVAQG